MTPAVTLKHADIPHLILREWQALHRLAAVSGDRRDVAAEHSDARPTAADIQDLMVRYNEARVCVRLRTFFPKQIGEYRLHRALLHIAIKMEGPDWLPLQR